MLFLCGVPCLALIVRYVVCKTEAAAAIPEALQEKVPSSGQSDQESFSAVGRSAPCGAGDFLTLPPTLKSAISPFLSGTAASGQGSEYHV